MSVGRLVGHTLLFYDFISLTSLLLPKWSGDLKYDPCPPARDFGKSVSGLVLTCWIKRHGRMDIKIMTFLRRRFLTLGPRFRYFFLSKLDLMLTRLAGSCQDVLTFYSGRVRYLYFR